MLLIFSSNANAESDQIEKELELASRKRVPVLPFRIEDVQPLGALEFHLGTRHWLDAITPPLEQHLNGLVESVKRYLPSPPPPTVVVNVVEEMTIAGVEEKIQAELQAIRAREVETAGRIGEEAVRRWEEEQLPDSEKEYDRQTAMETIKAMLALGYRLEKT